MRSGERSGRLGEVRKRWGISTGDQIWTLEVERFSGKIFRGTWPVRRPIREPVGTKAPHLARGLPITIKVFCIFSLSFLPLFSPLLTTCRYRQSDSRSIANLSYKCQPFHQKSFSQNPKEIAANHRNLPIARWIIRTCTRPCLPSIVFSRIVI